MRPGYRFPAGMHIPMQSSGAVPLPMEMLRIEFADGSVWDDISANVQYEGEFEVIYTEQLGYHGATPREHRTHYH